MPIVARAEAKFYSPWKRATRPLQGIMHGLYVFAVIDAFFEKMEELSDFPVPSYVRDRRQQIAEEVAQVRADKLTEDLTDFGALLYAAILARFT